MFIAPSISSTTTGHSDWRDVPLRHVLGDGQQPDDVRLRARRRYPWTPLPAKGRCQEQVPHPYRSVALGVLLLSASGGC